MFRTFAIINHKRSLGVRWSYSREFTILVKLQLALVLRGDCGAISLLQSPCRIANLASSNPGEYPIEYGIAGTEYEFDPRHTVNIHPNPYDIGPFDIQPSGLLQPQLEGTLQHESDDQMFASVNSEGQQGFRPPYHLRPRGQPVYQPHGHDDLHQVDHAGAHVRKHSRADEGELSINLNRLTGVPFQGSIPGQNVELPVELTTHPRHAEPFFPSPTSQYLRMTHHHHYLPNQTPLRRRRRSGYNASSTAHPSPQEQPSMVGREGMPPPAKMPRGPKVKFTPEEDHLLLELKEEKKLTWKNIAQFFPGRSSGTLQVRYCTKLKAKTTVWTDEAVRH